MRRPRPLAATVLNGVAPILVASMLVLLVSGCDGSTKSSPAQASGPRAVRTVADQLTSQGCSASMSSGSSSTVRYCEFVLPDGRRFNCNMASFQASVPTSGVVATSKSCVGLPRVSAPTASARVVKAIAKARACLTSGGLAVKGGPVPPEGHSPGGPEGELIVGGAFIAFYADPRIAKRAEPEVLRNARGFGGEVVRRGAVTILWIGPPGNDLRTSVQACAFS
jgi:hypothetical protein